MVAGVFAVVGVLLGSVSTLVVQTVMARRAETFAVGEKLRQQRMEAYCALADEAMEARRTQINRWYQRRDAGAGTAEYAKAKDESYRGRAAARRQRYKVQLVADDDRLIRKADLLIESMGPIHKAETEAEMERLAEHTVELIEDFVKSASAQLRADPAR